MPADAKDKIPFLAENRPRGVYPPSVRYAIAGACVVLALALSQTLGPLLGDQAPLIFFVAASFIAGWYGGLGPGLTALVTGLLLGDLFFMRSWQEIRAHNPSDVVLMMIYGGVGAIGLAAISSLHRTRFREERIRETAWRLRQDVAERSRAEEALRQAKEKLDFALEAARLCTWDLNLQTGEIEWRSESEYNTLLGLKPEGVRQRLESFLRRVHPEDRVLLKHTVTNCARKEIPCDVEFRVLRSDGSVHWFLAKGKLLRARDGKGDRMSGILMDITERKQTEEALRENQERYHALADATFDAVVIHENAVALEVNHSLCEMFGYEPGEVVGRNVIELLVEPESIAAVLEHVRTGSEEPYEAWVRRKDGSKLLVELRARNLAYKGRSVRVVSAHDITERKHAEQTLLESERVARRQVDELESLYESATVGRCFLDTNQRFVRINKWLAEVLGRPPAEHIGHSVWELAPSMANTLGPVFRKALETGVGVKDLEFQLPLASDPAHSPRDWLVNLDVLKENGHIIGVNTVISEITERKRMEKEVQRTLSLLTTTLEATADGILVVDLTGKVVRYNHKFAAMWRIPEALLAAQDDARLVSYVLDQLSEPDTFLRKIHELRNQPEAESQDELRFTDGRVFERHSHPQRLGSQVVGRVWSFHDVTERKRTEEAVRRSEAQLHEMADAMPQIVWTARPDGRIEFVNERWFEHGDLPGAEPYLDQAWRQLLHPDDADQAVKTVHTALQNGQAFQLQVRIKQRGDGYHWHLARALPWRDEAGRIFRWFGTCTDIEDQKRTEHALQAAKEQLDHHTRTLERRVVERTANLEETIRSLEGILYHIAHDLRAPLRAMAGFAQMLEESPHSHLDEEEKAFTQRIVTGAKRMDCLIQDLLAYGRLGHSRMALARMPLGPALERVLHKLAMKIKRKNADIQVIQPLPAVRADANVMDQVLVQLLTNAITFVPPNVTPRIRIWAEHRGSMVRLWIQDNGIGIEREHWERIFQVFERLHRVEEYTGTGIGLAIVHKGIERLGGTVGVESKPGEGSRFWLELPEAAGGK